jgi:hypothetical protein
MMLRWPLMLGFAILGLFLVRDLFGDQTVLAQAADLIKTHYPTITKSGWAELTANILNHPSSYPAELIAGLQNLLSNEWASKLSMVSFEGTVNPERILPVVLLFYVPMGLRGLIIVALLAAAMSTFNAIINMTTGFLTRDLYQAYLRPKASNKELIYASYFFSVFQVVVGMAMAYLTESINDIWGWLMMGLSAGMIVPAVLRLHWWRFNGGGYAIGTMTGLVAAIIQRIVAPKMIEWQQLVYILCIGIIGSVIGTYLTKPTSQNILENYYKKVRPFGLWGRCKHILPPDVLAATKKEHFNDIISVPFTFGWMFTILLMPMQLMVKEYNSFWATFGIFAVCMVALYFFWYRQLPPADNAANRVCETETCTSEKSDPHEVKKIKI